MGLKEYISKRTINTIIVLWLAITLNFVIFRLMPGDPLKFFLQDPTIKESTKLLFKQLWGLDKSPLEQYFYYIQNIFSGKLGISFHSGRYVIDEILTRLSTTLLLMAPSVILSLILGLIFGALASYKRGKKFDKTVMGLGLFVNSFPTFFLGLTLLLIFAYWLPLATNYLIDFPTRGTSDPGFVPGTLGYYMNIAWHMVLPVTTLTLINTFGWAFFVRYMLLDTLTKDFIIVAKAKGLDDRSVLFKHGLRNILPPVITYVALNLAGIIGGAVITETIFSLDGMGGFLFASITSKDYPVLEGIFFVLSLITLIANYVADIAYAFVDPRIRY